MKKLILCTIFGLGISLSAFAGRLADLEKTFIDETRTAHHSVSHQAGLVNTIDSLFDCTSHGRIQVALIGVSEVPKYVFNSWKKQNPDCAQISISRYRMALDAKNPDSKTDFYRFRSVQSDDKVVETFIQDIYLERRAMRIFTFVNGDPTGQFKNIQSVLEELLYIVEEGTIEVEMVSTQNTPQKVFDLWRANCAPEMADKPFFAEAFRTNSPQGNNVYWRLSIQEANGFEQSILIFNNDLVYNNLNGKIETK
ncbi:MAG: hypothetical protein HQM08_05120 [Candidatus Riflebacteria bacterium]|nr:hypothetical protein [Candidatus Riflebacteria bacterium]